MALGIIRLTIREAKGAQCFSGGRVLDSRPQDCGFEPHWLQCVVSLSKAY